MVPKVCVCPRGGRQKERVVASLGTVNRDETDNELPM